MLLCSFLLFLVLLTVSGYNFEEDYEKLKHHYECDEHCYFDQELITVSSIDLWPKDCNVVCGTITLTSRSRISFSKLKNAFQKLKVLKGGLRIVDTTFRNLSFLPEALKVDCDIIGTSILNNSLLDNADLIFGIPNITNCSFSVSKNPLLDTTSVCHHFDYENYFDWKIFGNKKDCVCVIEKLDSSNAQLYKDCKYIYGGLEIGFLDNEIPDLSNLKILNGHLRVQLSNAIEDLSFMENLETIVSDIGSPGLYEYMHLYMVDNIKRLGLKSLKNLVNSTDQAPSITFQNTGSLCLTVEEINMFLDANAQFFNIDASYCPEITWNSEKPELCIFKSMETLPSNCIYIYGNLVIGFSEEKYVDKLENVKRVFGSVTVKDNNLKNLDFFEKLETIVNLEVAYKPTLHVLNNRNLKSIRFPSSKKFWNDRYDFAEHVVFSGNNIELFKTVKECEDLEVVIGLKIFYNGGRCGSIIALNRTNTNINNCLINPNSEGCNPSTTLNTINFIASIIGFLINIVNLIVLFQNDLRTTFMFILMIGISVSEIQLVSTFIVKYLFDNNWLYTPNNCGFKYYHVLFNMLNSSILSMAKRCFSFVIVIMTMLKLCLAMLPSNSTMLKLSTPKSAILMLLGLFLFCFLWDIILGLKSKCQIQMAADQTCHNLENSYLSYELQCPSEESATDDFAYRWSKIVTLFSGFSTVFIWSCYFLIIGMLFYQLKKSQGADFKEDTLLLVTVIFMSYMVVEAVALFLDSKIMWTCLIINSSVYVFLCFFLSNQYQKVVRGMFSRPEKTRKMALASISTSLVERSSGDEKCIFTQEIINMTTISEWPSDCDKVCGVMTLNQDSNVPETMLAAKFEKMWWLIGGIRIENTTYKNLDFFPPTDYFYIRNKVFGVSLVNNSYLKSAAPIFQMIQTERGVFRVTGNPKLDTTPFCNNNNAGTTVEWDVYGNKADCGCKGSKLTWNNTQIYAECEYIMGKLIITDLRNQLPNLMEVKQINGYLEVKNTTLEDLSCLANLHTIKSLSYWNTDVILNIHDNPNMKRLGLPFLEKTISVNNAPFQMNFERLHPDFCLTIEEMSMMLDNIGGFYRVQANYCPVTNLNWSASKPKLCVFETMARLDTGCVFIAGHLLVESGDEDYVRKLVNVTRVMGSVTIRNTSLGNCYFLRKLEHVVNLNDSLPIMQFLFNKNMQELELPNAIHFWDKGENNIVFLGNHDNIFKTTRYCLMFQYSTQTNVSYNGSGCKSINKTLPSDVGFDFDTGIDYLDYSEKDVWWDEYDGDFYYINTTAFNGVFDVLNSFNYIISVLGFLINNVNLIVLFQRDLRSIFIFILMIGISVCDIQLATTFLVKYTLDHDWIYQKDECNGLKYYHAVFNMLKDPILSMARRCSSFLALLMALFRTLSVTFPLNSTISNLTKPQSAIFMVFGLFLICLFWDFALIGRCEIFYYKENEDCYIFQKSYMPYNYTCPSDNLYDYSTPLYKIISLLDGFSTVATAVVYLAVTIALLVQLKSVQKRRKALKEEKSENTFLLVTLMAVTYFISEMIYGASYIFDELVFAYFPRLS